MQRAGGRYRFGFLFDDFAAGSGASTANVQHVVCKVHIRPVQTAVFLAAQSEISCELDDQLQAMPFGALQQTCQILR